MVRTHAKSVGGASDDFSYFLFSTLRDMSPWATNQAPIDGGDHWQAASEPPTQSVVPKKGKIRRLYFQVLTPPGAGNGWYCLLRLNGANTLLFAAFVSPALGATDLVNEIDVVAGDIINFELGAWVGVGANTMFKCSVEFVAT